MSARVGRDSQVRRWPLEARIRPRIAFLAVLANKEAGQGAESEVETGGGDGLGGDGDNLNRTAVDILDHHAGLSAKRGGWGPRRIRLRESSPALHCCAAGAPLRSSSVFT